MTKEKSDVVGGDAMSEEEQNDLLGVVAGDDENKVDTDKETAAAESKTALDDEGEEGVDTDDEGEEGVDTDDETAGDKKSDDPYKAAFDEMGLGGQFTDAMDALRRLPDFNQYAGTLQNQNAALQREIEELKKVPVERPKIDPDEFPEEFGADPIGALAKHGIAKKEEVDELRTELNEFRERDTRRNVADAISEFDELKDIATAMRIGQKITPGTNKFWDAMNREFSKFPGLDAPTDVLVRMMYDRVKPTFTTKAKPKVPVVPKEKKEEATTTDSKAGTKAKGGDGKKKDTSKMTPEAELAYYESQGLVGP